MLRAILHAIAAISAGNNLHFPKRRNRAVKRRTFLISKRLICRITCHVFFNLLKR